MIRNLQIKQKHTKHTTIHTMTKKWKQKNMKECDKRKSHVSRKLHMIHIPSNNVRRPVTKTFTTLHYATLYSTSLRYTFHLHGFLVTRNSTYVHIRGCCPVHTHYLRTVLREKKYLPCNAAFLFVTAIFVWGGGGCVIRIHFRFSKQKGRRLLRT
jgi:hypothetical protein